MILWLKLFGKCYLKIKYTKNTDFFTIILRNFLYQTNTINAI